MSSLGKKQKKEDQQSIKNDGKIRCNVCRRYLTNERYLRCVQCTDFTQCLECYSIANDRPPHNIEHVMAILDANPIEILEKGWNSNEEVLLLAALRAWGTGNWNRVAEWIPTKTALEIQTHYFKVYLESSAAPIPVSEIIPKNPLPPPPDYSTEPKESRPSMGNEKYIMLTEKREVSTPAEYNGYMPYRHEFEIEYNNDAESIIADVAFSNSKDSEQTFNLKVDQLLSYNEQLSERKLRIKTIEGWDIQNMHLKTTGQQKLSSDSEITVLKGLTADEKLIDSILLPLSQYVGADKIKDIDELIHRRNRLLQRIDTRRKWQAQGVRTIQEGHLINSITPMIKDNIIPNEEYVKWNNSIKQFIDGSRNPHPAENELLTPQEIDLCKDLSIKSKQYLAFKDLIIRECSIRNRLSLDDFCGKFQDDYNVLSAVFHFCTEKGWINT